jgi:hypothetical protein
MLIFLANTRGLIDAFRLYMSLCTFNHSSVDDR